MSGVREAVKAVIQTYTGRMIDVCNVRVEDIALADIALPLGRLCRFNGHTREFYSVAQHSVLVAWLAHEWSIKAGKSKAEALEAARWGLLHDAHEAYLGDIVAPLKPLAGKLGESWSIVNFIDKAIRCKFGVHDGNNAFFSDSTSDQLVRNADALALLLERSLLLAHERPWDGLESLRSEAAKLDVSRLKMACYSSEDAASRWLCALATVTSVDSSLNEGLTTKQVLDLQDLAGVSGEIGLGTGAAEKAEQTTEA